MSTLTLTSSCIENLIPVVKRVDPEWSDEHLYAQSGLFPLAQVWRLTPLSAKQIRKEAKRLRHPREVMGVFKPPGKRTYLVDMARFQTWIRRLA